MKPINRIPKGQVGYRFFREKVSGQLAPPLPPGNELGDGAKVHLREIETPAWMDAGDYVLWQDGSDYICTGIREGGLIAWRVKPSLTIQGDGARSLLPDSVDWERQHTAAPHIRDAMRLLRRSPLTTTFTEQPWALVWVDEASGEVRMDGESEFVGRLQGALEAAEN